MNEISGETTTNQIFPNGWHRRNTSLLRIWNPSSPQLPYLLGVHRSSLQNKNLNKKKKERKKEKFTKKNQENEKVCTNKTKKKQRKNKEMTSPVEDIFTDS